MSRRRRIVALAALLLGAGITATVVLVQSGGHTASAAGSGVPAGFTTTTVERRTLTERSTVSGTLGFAATAEVYDRIAGTYTWLPSVGAVIGRGGTLFKVNNLPIVLMYGSVPAYRTLKAGIGDGPDVRELNANLVALGYDTSGALTVDDHFSEATAAAVKRWQHADGLTETGDVELGRIVFAPGARRVTTVHVVLGQDPPGTSSESSAPSGSSKASDSNSHKRSGPRKPSGSKKSTGKGKSPGSKNGPGSNPSSKSGDDGSGKGSPSSSEKPSSDGKEGSPSSGAAAVLVLSTTADAQIVTVQLKASQQELARVGEAVPVALPDGRSVHGHVSEVGTVASESSGENEGNGKGSNGGSPGGGSSSGNGENATISVKVTLNHPVAHLDKAPVSVELVRAVRRNVLAVPATALVATGGGGFAVQALEANRRVEIAVTPGMFANGYVEVDGSGLGEGMTVLEPS